MSKMGSENTVAVLRQKISPSKPQITPADKVFEKKPAQSTVTIRVAIIWFEITDFKPSYLL